jgi:hypothetical protein
MKTLVAAVAVAAFIVSPAVAHSAREHPAESGPAASVPWDAVIEEGRIVGQDPDPNVRLELRRDYDSINR